MKTAARLFITLLCGSTLSVFASTPAALENDITSSVQVTPVVEMHALNADQAQALADARAEYRRDLEDLERAHQEKLNAILGKPATRTSAI